VQVDSKHDVTLSNTRQTETLCGLRARSVRPARLPGKPGRLALTPKTHMLEDLWQKSRRKRQLAGGAARLGGGGEREALISDSQRARRTPSHGKRCGRRRPIDLCPYQGEPRPSAPDRQAQQASCGNSFWDCRARPPGHPAPNQRRRGQRNDDPAPTICVPSKEDAGQDHRSRTARAPAPGVGQS
jgi:hypothetical protein